MNVSSFEGRNIILMFFRSGTHKKISFNLSSVEKVKMTVPFHFAKLPL